MSRKVLLDRADPLGATPSADARHRVFDRRLNRSDVSPDGTPLVDDDFLVFVNAWGEPLTFTVPAALAVHRWQIVCDTFEPARDGAAGPPLQVWPRSAVILRSPG